MDKFYYVVSKKPKRSLSQGPVYIHAILQWASASKVLASSTVLILLSITIDYHLSNFSRQLLAERAGGKGVCLVAADSNGDLFMLTMSAVKNEATLETEQIRV